jgi:hypothetical protein
VKTVILLIDFKGHPALGSEYLNNRRYAEVQKILTDTQIDRSKIIFAVSKGNKDLKLEELKFMAKHLDIKYYEYDSHITFEDLQKQLLQHHNFLMGTDNTQIIIGGTNTAGCVIKSSKPMNAINSYIKGYATTIYLPMCAEYEQPGINDIERTMVSLVDVYKWIKKYGAYKIKLETNYTELNLPKK